MPISLTTGESELMKRIRLRVVGRIDVISEKAGTTVLVTPTTIKTDMLQVNTAVLSEKTKCANSRRIHC